MELTEQNFKQWDYAQIKDYLCPMEQDILKLLLCDHLSFAEIQSQLKWSNSLLQNMKECLFSRLNEIYISEF